MARTLQIFSKIQSLRGSYYRALPGKESLIRVVMEAEIAEHVYNSNAIENSTLTLEDTEKILLQVDLDRFVSEREIFEAKNLARVVAYTENKAREAEISLELMLLLHKMLIGNIREDVAGRFRQGNEWVRVGTHIGADPKDIVRLLTDMLTEYHASASGHIVKRVARFHLTFENIHPFIDGNGRIGRALNNYVLIREGYVPINIAFVNRARYYDAFKEFEGSGRTAVMEEIIGRALTVSYHKRLAYLEGKRIITLAQYAKETKQSHPNLINKAHRQTIPAFTEKGEWKIGV
ncbi:MAG: Fic family protein [Candidatus Sungbacteria bacterium]|nr:Fic family protein [Candidatus Sungbacteria bacterium]